MLTRQQPIDPQLTACMGGYTTPRIDPFAQPPCQYEPSAPTLLADDTKTSPKKPHLSLHDATVYANTQQHTQWNG